VFADPEALASLNAIVHPLVRKEIALAILREEAGHSPAPVALVDAALLVESGIHRDLDAVVVVTCPPEEQVRRAVLRGMSESEARARISSQAPLEAKLAAATHVIDNGGAVDETRRRVREVWESVRSAC
jgi:dephospho-CoA kinase